MDPVCAGSCHISSFYFVVGIRICPPIGQLQQEDSQGSPFGMQQPERSGKSLILLPSVPPLLESDTGKCGAH